MTGVKEERKEPIMKNVKVSKKLINKEMSHLSKQERKVMNDLNWAGKGTIKPSCTIESKKFKSQKRRKGELASKIRRGFYD